jgi:hypothetical protein
MKPRGELGFLLHVAETGSLAQRYFSAIWLDGAGENLQQRRFAGAVGPNQPDAVPFGNGEGDTPKERCGPVGFRDILCVENRRHVVWLSLGSTVRIAGVSVGAGGKRFAGQMEYLRTTGQFLRCELVERALSSF